VGKKAIDLKGKSRGWNYGARPDQSEQGFMGKAGGRGLEKQLTQEKRGLEE